ncbi:hypothetical protein DL96DRAFT_1722168 [Flagelloscypha sp. PMI_526]|nr:hypothetical protein DL96DRAFT_1722168 [Flagelloscypha sp. PMI_526]
MHIPTIPSKNQVEMLRFENGANKDPFIIRALALAQLKVTIMSLGPSGAAQPVAKLLDPINFTLDFVIAFKTPWNKCGCG